MITETLSTLKIHKLSQEQYDRELAAGTLDDNALYLTDDEDGNLDIDLEGYVQYEEINEYTEETNLINVDSINGLETYVDSRIATRNVIAPTTVATSAIVNGDNSLAIGNASTVALGSDSIAIGHSASVTDVDNCVAIGANSIVTYDDLNGDETAGVFSVGSSTNTRRIINVTDPINDQDVSTKAYVDSKIHASTSEPTASDGNDGDIWIVYEA